MGVKGEPVEKRGYRTKGDDAATLDSWITYTIDSEGDVGSWTSIAIDSNDKVHISYFDDIYDDLKYATNAEVE